MKIDKVLREARETLAQLCECSHFDSEHCGPYTKDTLMSTGPCDSAGCGCQTFTRASLVVMRVDVNTPQRRKRSPERT